MGEGEGGKEGGRVPLLPSETSLTEVRERGREGWREGGRGRLVFTRREGGREGRKEGERERTQGCHPLAW